MKKLAWFVVAFLIIVVINGAYPAQANTQGKTIQQTDGKTFSEKVELLRNEMKKYQTVSHHMGKHAIYSKAAELMEEILHEKDSIFALPQDILGDESNFELKYPNEFIINDVRYKIVTFQTKETGYAPFTTFTAIYVQKWDDKGLYDVQRLGSIGGQLLYGGFMPSNRANYILVAAKTYNETGRISIEVSAYKLAGQKWTRQSGSNGPLTKNGWEIREHQWTYQGVHDGYVSLDHEKKRDNPESKENDYEIKIIQPGEMQVALVNANRQALASLTLTIQDGIKITSLSGESDWVLVGTEGSSVQSFVDRSTIDVYSNILSWHQKVITRTKSKREDIKYYQCEIRLGAPSQYRMTEFIYVNDVPAFQGQGVWRDSFEKPYDLIEYIMKSESVQRELGLGNILDPHWYRDEKHGSLIWNPNPGPGETVRWEGTSAGIGNNVAIVKGERIYSGTTSQYWVGIADGEGEAFWYKNGVLTQKDKGRYIYGKRHGKFIQTFSDGRVVISEWDHGDRIN